jgi:DNA-binding SARP family transcriptional activator
MAFRCTREEAIDRPGWGWTSGAVSISARGARLHLFDPAAQVAYVDRDGNCAEALLVYEELRTRLREELGVTPSEPTQALHRRLLR